MFHSTAQDDHNHHQSQLNPPNSASMQKQYLTCLQSWQKELTEITTYVKSYAYDAQKEFKEDVVGVRY